MMSSSQKNLAAPVVNLSNRKASSKGLFATNILKKITTRQGLQSQKSTIGKLSPQAARKESVDEVPEEEKSHLK